MAKKVKVELSVETLDRLSDAIKSVESYERDSSFLLQVFSDGTAKGLALYGDEAEKASLAMKPFWDSAEPYDDEDYGC
jgi:hypothetical protein